MTSGVLQWLIFGAYIAIPGLVMLGVTWVAMSLTAKYIHPYAAIAIGTAVLVYLLYAIIQDRLYCASDEQFWVPPDDANGREGYFAFRCDSPSEMLGVFAQVVGVSVTLVGVALKSWRLLRTKGAQS